MATYTPKKSEIERTWHLVDAEGLVLGRMATEVAKILRGKHKPTYAPHIDTGDHVIVINADKVVLTSGRQNENRIPTYWFRGIKSDSYEELLAKKPADIVRQSIRGMILKQIRQTATIKIASLCWALAPTPGTEANCIRNRSRTSERSLKYVKPTCSNNRQAQKSRRSSSG